MYFGSSAEAIPAAKTPKRVQTDPASSASPPTTAAGRCGRRQRRGRGSRQGQGAGGTHERARAAFTPGLCDHAQASFGSLGRQALGRCREHRRATGRTALARWRDDQCHPRGGGRRRRREQVGKFSVSPVPGGNGGVGGKDGGV